VRAVVSVSAVEETPQSTEPSKHKRHKDKPRKAHRTQVEIDEDDAEQLFSEPTEPQPQPDEPAEPDEDRKHDKDHDDDRKKHDEHDKGHGKKR
jgi:hypothetical protein